MAKICGSLTKTSGLDKPYSRYVRQPQFNDAEIQTIAEALQVPVVILDKYIDLLAEVFSAL